MADNKQFQQVDEATGERVTSLRETNQTIADSLVSLQGCYLKFAQRRKETA